MSTYILDANQRPAIKKFIKKQKIKAEILEFLERTFKIFLVMLIFTFLFASLFLSLIPNQPTELTIFFK